jgi:hypothetical protein
MTSLRFHHAVVPALATVAFLAAGCGGGGKSPGVANVGTATTTAATPSGSASNAGDKARMGPAFSQCMRSHGVHNFPDPSAQGGINISPATGINPDSPTFQAAQRACQKLLHITPPSPAQQAKMQQAALRFSACMRSHGVHNFPDPTFGPGTVQLRVNSKSGLDPRSPIFQAAQRACQKLMPGPTGGAVTSQSGK